MGVVTSTLLLLTRRIHLVNTFGLLQVLRNLTSRVSCHTVAVRFANWEDWNVIEFPLSSFPGFFILSGRNFLPLRTVQLMYKRFEYRNRAKGILEK